MFRAHGVLFALSMLAIAVILFAGMRSVHTGATVMAAALQGQAR